MAYRFNPPPNWPVNEPGWTPPAGWQPDPSWGPAPEGWEFWVSDESSSQDTQVAPGSEGEQHSTAGETSPLAPAADSAPAASPYGYGNTGDQGAPTAQASESGNDGAEFGHSAPEFGAPQYTQDSSYSPQYGQDASSAPQYSSGGSGNGSSATSQMPAYDSAHSAPSWQSASEAQPVAEPEKKGLLARFWWVGCIILFLLALIVGAIALIASALFGTDKGSDDASASPAASTTTEPSASSSTDAATTQSTDSATTDPATASPTAESSESKAPGAGNVLPGPTPGANAQTKDISTWQGKGKLTMSTQWLTNDEVKQLGADIPAASQGQYLMVVAKVEATEGKVFFNPLEPTVTTPYGGTIEYSPNTYMMDNNGMESGISDIPAGTTATMAVLYDCKKVDGLVLSYEGDETGQKWPVPTK